MRKILALLFALVMIPVRALATQTVVPYVFSPGQTIYSAQVNADFNAIYGAFNTGVDNTNIGPAGIYASQIIPTTAAQATFGGSVPYTFTTPLSGASGGIGPLTGPPIQAGDKIVGFGDSLIANNAGATTCSLVTTVHTPTGTCMLDQLGIATSASVANLGLGGTCLEVTATGGGACNTASSGFSRYQNANTAGNPGFTGLLSSPANTWIVIDYGTNDWIKGDPGTSGGLYYTQLKAIISWLIASPQNIPPNHIILVSMEPVNPQGGTNGVTQLFPELPDIAVQVGKVAAQNQTLYADAYSPLAGCWLAGTGINPLPLGARCDTDGVHPNAAGSLLVVAAVRAATYSNAISAQTAWSAAQLSGHQPALISPYIGTGASGLAATFFNSAAGVNYTPIVNWINASGAAISEGPIHDVLWTVPGDASEFKFGSTVLQTLQGAGNFAVAGIAHSAGNSIEPAGTANVNGVQIGNASTGGGTQYTRLATITGCAVGSGVVNGTLLSIDDAGVAYKLCMNTSGDLQTAGQLYAEGVNTRSGGVTTLGSVVASGVISAGTELAAPTAFIQNSYLPPLLNASGGAALTAATAHMVTFDPGSVSANGSCADGSLCAGTPQTQTLTGAGTFPVGAQCWSSGNTASWVIQYTANVVTFRYNNTTGHAITGGTNLGDPQPLCIGQ
ncbi:MAG: SGNH/GDSL hydrolase family protein [Candidatus Tumulicola sp.]